jgi:threonine dehydrogenase-like Zn-dependent dehydrogenase
VTVLETSPTAVATGRMTTVAVTGRRQCRLTDKPRPTIRRNYVLLKVHVAPMCNEYLAYQELVYLERNRADSLGHEMAGEVIAAPPSAAIQPGDRVVALCGYPCGRCVPCLRGYYAHCAQTEDPREVCASESGECGFAQYAIKPDWMLVPIPDSVSYEHASMTCCGLGPTFGAMERMGVDAYSTVLITGLGAVGLGGVINGKFRNARVIGVARSAYRARLARQLGCDVVLDPYQDDVVEAVNDLTGGHGVDFALECSGQAQYQRLLVDCVGRLGKVAFLAEPGELRVHVDNDLVQKGVTLLGTLDINRRDSDRLMRMIQAIPDQIDTLITHRMPLADIDKAFELQMSRECGKVILYPWHW